MRQRIPTHRDALPDAIKRRHRRLISHWHQKLFKIGGRQVVTPAARNTPQIVDRNLLSSFRMVERNSGELRPRPL